MFNSGENYFHEFEFMESVPTDQERSQHTHNQILKELFDETAPAVALTALLWCQVQR
jgi:hypothetical protein